MEKINFAPIAMRPVRRSGCGQMVNRFPITTVKTPNHFEDITDIPKEEQKLEDILSERFTLKNLTIKDKLVNERKSLKSIILEMEDEVLANAGVDVFEEVFKTYIYQTLR